MPRLSLQVALGVGAAGALVDVSSYARLDDGLRYRWGRDDAFNGVEPGTFSFVLDNADGRFTPENASSPLVTKLSEGARACVSVGGRLTAGTVRSVEPEFPGGAAAWATVRVTCDDMLGEAARTRITDVSDAVAENAGLFGLWKFADPTESSVAVDSGPLGLPPFQSFSTNTGVAFGDAPLPWSAETQARMGGTINASQFSVTIGDTFDYLPSSGGAFGFWITVYQPVALGGSSLFFRIIFSRRTSGHSLVISVEQEGANLFASASGSTTTLGASLTLGVPSYVSVAVSVVGANVQQDIYLDGVLIGARSYAHGGATSAADLSPTSIVIQPGANDAVTAYSFSRLSHTRTLAREHLVQSALTEAGTLELVGAASDVTLAALPSGLSDVPVERPQGDGDSALDIINDVMLAEQGDVYARTTGTLTNPTETVTVRERVRPRTVSYTFDVERELSGAPDFIRDLTNLVSAVRVENSTREVYVEDSTLRARAGGASDSETLILQSENELRAWGQDRLIRGANTQMRIASVVVDAMTTPTDRSADLLALVPGDRVQFTGLPSTILGFDTWDGWFLGADESHSTEAHEFTLHFTPVLPDVAIFDTDRYVDEVLTLSGNINASVTSMSIATTGDKLTTTDLPLTVLVDSEQITITACTSATPQVATITRGANGTTAASHTSGAAVTVLPDSIYAF